jgi:CHAD domain-containing protein
MSRPTMREFALLQTAVLLRRLAFEVNRAAKNGDHVAVHDLRVAIRRFSRCLRVFAQFYPAASWKKIRRQLADLMEAAGGVRDRDIALQLLDEAGVPKEAAMAVRLQDERRQAGQGLLRELRGFRTHNLFRKWRDRLELKP